MSQYCKPPLLFNTNNINSVETSTTDFMNFQETAMYLIRELRTAWVCWAQASNRVAATEDFDQPAVLSAPRASHTQFLLRRHRELPPRRAATRREQRVVCLHETSPPRQPSSVRDRPTTHATRHERSQEARRRPATGTTHRPDDRFAAAKPPNSGTRQTRQSRVLRSWRLGSRASARCAH